MQTKWVTVEPQRFSKAPGPSSVKGGGAAHPAGLLGIQQPEHWSSLRLCADWTPIAPHPQRPHTEFTVQTRLGPGAATVGRTAWATLAEPWPLMLTESRSYLPGWEYTVPTSILKDPTRVPLRSRFLE